MAVERHEVMAAAEAAQPGTGKLINDARNAGIPWMTILSVLVANIGPQLIQALVDLIANWNKPKPPTA